MKAYYLIVGLLATIGISLLIPDYPVLIGTKSHMEHWLGKLKKLANGL